MRAVEIHVLKGEPPQIELIDHLKGDQNILLHGRGLLLALNLPHFSLTHIHPLAHEGGVKGLGADREEGSIEGQGRWTLNQAMRKAIMT